jgi:hypothetical protein
MFVNVNLLKILVEVIGIRRGAMAFMIVNTLGMIAFEKANKLTIRVCSKIG